MLWIKDQELFKTIEKYRGEIKALEALLGTDTKKLMADRRVWEQREKDLLQQLKDREDVEYWKKQFQASQMLVADLMYTQSENEYLLLEVSCIKLSACSCRDRG